MRREKYDHLLQVRVSESYPRRLDETASELGLNPTALARLLLRERGSGTRRGGSWKNMKTM